jgi:hypothetical protein
VNLAPVNLTLVNLATLTATTPGGALLRTTTLYATALNAAPLGATVLETTTLEATRVFDVCEVGREGVRSRRLPEHSAGFADHLLGAVDALDDCPGPANRQVRCPFARAAAQVNDVCRGLDVDPGEELEERPGSLGGVRPVLSRVPNIS